MAIRNAFVLVIGVAIVAGGGLAMSTQTNVANNGGVQMYCRVAPLQPQMQEGFEYAFCNALAGFLRDELDTEFQLVSGDVWAKEGGAVLVDVRPSSANGADVTITSGRVGDGAFIAGTPVELSLYNSDKPLAPSSSRALVRGIGIQMELVR